MVIKTPGKTYEVMEPSKVKIEALYPVNTDPFFEDPDNPGVYYFAGKTVRIPQSRFRVYNSTEEDLDKMETLTAEVYIRDDTGGVASESANFVYHPIRTALPNIEGYVWAREDGKPLFEKDGVIWLPMPAKKEYILVLRKKGN